MAIQNFFFFLSLNNNHNITHKNIQQQLLT